MCGKIFRRSWPSLACNCKKNPSPRDSHGNPVGIVDGFVLGKRGSVRSLRNAQDWDFPLHVVYAIQRISYADRHPAASWRMGPLARWLWLAARMGLGNSGRLVEYLFHTGAVSLI